MTRVCANVYGMASQISTVAAARREKHRDSDGKFGEQPRPAAPVLQQSGRNTRVGLMHSPFSVGDWATVDIEDGDVIVRSHRMHPSTRRDFERLFQTRSVPGQAGVYEVDFGGGMIPERYRAVKLRSTDVARFVEWMNNPNTQTTEYHNKNISHHPDLKAWAEHCSAELELDRDQYVSQIPSKLNGMELKPHQLEAAALIARSRGFALMDDMGLGKTLSALAGVAAKRQWPLLIACPASLVETHWLKQCQQMIAENPECGARTVYAWKGIPKRSTDKPLHHDIVIISHQSLETCRKKGWAPHFKAMIIDEAHELRNPRNKYTKAVTVACDEIPDDGTVLALTGTPLVNRPADLRPLLTMIGRYGEFDTFADPMLSVAKSDSIWESAFDDDDNATIQRRNQTESFRATLFDGDNPIAIRRTKQDGVVDLPTIGHTTTFLEYDHAFASAYEPIQEAILTYLEQSTQVNMWTPVEAKRKNEELAAAYHKAVEAGLAKSKRLADGEALMRLLHRTDAIATAGDSDDEIADASEAAIDALADIEDPELRARGAEMIRLALSGKLFPTAGGREKRKGSNSFRLMGILRRTVAVLQAHQVADKVQEYLDNRPPDSGRVLVFCQHHDMATTLSSALNAQFLNGRSSQKQRVSVLEDWKSDEPDPMQYSKDVLILGTGAFGTGHTITEADKVFFAEQPWTAAAQDQAQDRAHRIGQTRPVNVETLVMPNTVDMFVAATVEKKRLAINATMEGRYIDSAGFESQTSALIKALLTHHNKSATEELDDSEQPAPAPASVSV